MLPYSRLTSLITCLLMAGLVMSCRSRDPNPELHDPIFADLNSSATSLASKVDGQKKKIEELELNVEKMAPRDPARKRTTKEIYDLKRGLVLMEQQQKYFEIRAEQRKKYARDAYDRAFDRGEEWPPKDEFWQYKEFQKMKFAPRNWDERVPKTDRYQKPAPTPVEEAKPTEGGGGGAHH